MTPSPGRVGLHAAVDLGASSGRVILGRVDGERVDLVEVHRFANGACEVAGGLFWDVLGLWREVLDGLGTAGRLAHREYGAPLETIGIDTWAIDYGLLAADGTLLGNPRSYRDARTEGVAERVHAERLGAAALYARNGLQHLSFTTIYQLVAEAQGPLLGSADQLLLMPDLFAYWLTGHRGAEATNASTTGLVDVSTGRWSLELLTAAGVDPALLPPVHEPGTLLGRLRDDVRARTGLPPQVHVVAVGSHDTASAVVGVPARIDRFAYIACGTWGLVGVELDAPVLSEASRLANFTNERGVDGRIRYLRNVMGLWVLQQCLADWGLDGSTAELEALLDAAGRLPGGGPVVDIDDPGLLAPGPMVTRLQDLARSAGESLDPARPVVVRCVLDSLARAFASALRDARQLSDRDVDVVHLVGGGARNSLLCQLTADASRLPVLAGPVEATALGNVLVQARAVGSCHGGLQDLRDIVAASVTVVRYDPATAPQHPVRRLD